jgi:hypothetical protein
MTQVITMRLAAILIVALTASLAIALVQAQPSQAFRDRDCSDFPNQKKAQRYFKRHGGPRKDPSRLDADHDGIACEDNKCPCSHRSAAESKQPAARTQRMTIKAAKFYISRQLKDTYGNVWKNGSHKTWKGCKNVSAVRVRCKVGWLSGHYVYAGPVYAYYRASDPDSVYIGIRDIRRFHV